MLIALLQRQHSSTKWRITWRLCQQERYWKRWPSTTRRHPTKGGVLERHRFFMGSGILRCELRQQFLKKSRPRCQIRQKFIKFLLQLVHALRWARNVSNILFCRHQNSSYVATCSKRKKAGLGACDLWIQKPWNILLCCSKSYKVAVYLCGEKEIPVLHAANLTKYNYNLKRK